MPIHSSYRLNLDAIEASLREVQRKFPRINAVLRSRRDSMTNEVVEHMLAGYAFVDHLLSQAVDLFDFRHVQHMLELNPTTDEQTICHLSPAADPQRQSAPRPAQL